MVFSIWCLVIDVSYLVLRAAGYGLRTGDRMGQAVSTGNRIPSNVTSFAF